MRKLCCAVLALSAITVPVHAAIYKCVVKGERIFQDQPCPGTTIELQKPVTVTDTRQTSAGSKSIDSASQLMSEFGTDLYSLDAILFMTSARKQDTPSKSAATLCMEKYRQDFKDPSSVYLVDSASFRRDSENFVIAYVAARNGFGGFARQKLYCDSAVNDDTDPQH